MDSNQVDLRKQFSELEIEEISGFAESVGASFFLENKHFDNPETISLSNDGTLTHHFEVYTNTFGNRQIIVKKYVDNIVDLKELLK
jgi:hypothetical protein